MPHCVIEHSNALASAELMSSVYEGAVESGLFDKSGKDIKVRALPYAFFQTATEKSDFVHVTLKILSGRTTAQKQVLSSLVLEKLVSLSYDAVSLTVEVQDMDRDSYAKLVL